MNITVLGCGRWGSFLAWYHGQNHEVTLWGMAGDKIFEELAAKSGTNSYLTLPPSVSLTSDLEKAVNFADVIVISISSQHLHSFAANINKHNVQGKLFILCMKGIDAKTGERLSQVIKSEIKQDIKLAVWVGPGHVQDFVAGVPNCMVVDSDSQDTVDWIVDNLNSDLIRLYKGHDLIGTEIGAAAKNVIGIAAGMLDGKNISSLKGALMARGAREVSRLIKAMGGSELSAYGLCHLGDYEATLFSPHSHNRRYGESYIKGEEFNYLAEGVETARAMLLLGEKHGVELPICQTVYDIVFNKKDASYVLSQLFNRSVKHEFDA